jgi:hypothetical protein
MLSEFTAHCHPSFWGDLACEKVLRITEMSMPGRTTKFVSAIFASILAGTPLTIISHSETVGSRRRCAPGRPLVLPHRAQHQTPLLASPRGGRAAVASSPSEYFAPGEAACAASRASLATCGGQRPGRTAAAAEPQRRAKRRSARGCGAQCHPASECVRRKPFTGHCRFALARAVGGKSGIQSTTRDEQSGGQHADRFNSHTGARRCGSYSCHRGFLFAPSA